MKRNDITINSPFHFLASEKRNYIFQTMGKLSSSSSFVSALLLFVATTTVVVVAADDEFTLGVWYGGGRHRAPSLSRDPNSEREMWEADLKNISALGFNAVKVWVDWATAEQREGAFDFSALEQVFDIIEKEGLGLKVIIQVYADSSPDWVGVKHPDGEFVGSNDRHIHSQSAPGYCFDHPGVRELMLRFYREVGRAAARHAGLVYGFDVWSEPHIVNWVVFWDMSSTSVEFCYCNHTMSRFREYLRTKYDGDLNRLNAAWYRTFGSWAQVEPPRFGTIISYADYLDWIYEFIPHKIAEDLALKSEALRNAFVNTSSSSSSSSDGGNNNGGDKEVVITAHSSNPSLTGTPFDDYGMADDWLMSEALRTAFSGKYSESSNTDNTKTVGCGGNGVGGGMGTRAYYGSSFYPIFPGGAYGGRDDILGTIAYTGAYSASGRRGFFVGELQAGQGASGMTVNVPVTPAHHRDWIWSLIAHGAKSISVYAYYPMNTGYESGGFGLVNLDGTATERAVAAGAVARVVGAHQGLLARSLPEAAEVAVLYNPVAYYLGGNLGGPGGSIMMSTRGIYGAFYTANPAVPVEFVHASDAERGLLIKNNYKLLVLPFPLALSNATARAIMRFIDAGGAVAAEARVGWTDALGTASPRIPGLGLDAYFGAYERELRPINSAEAASFTYTFGPDAPAHLAGTRVPSSTFEEVLVPDAPTAKVVATFADGSPAVVTNTRGAGKTMLIGSSVGLPSKNADPGARKTIAALLEWAGVKPLVRSVVNGGENFVPRVICSEKDGNTLISINRSPNTSCSPTLTLGFSAKKATVITDGDAPLEFTDNGDGTINVTLPEIPPKEVCVVNFN